MEKEQNVKWLLAISVVLFIFTAGLLPMLEYPIPSYYRSNWSVLENLLFYVHRTNILCFVATITAATLYTTDFEKKDSMFKVSMYLFQISMILFSVSLLKPVLT